VEHKKNEEEENRVCPIKNKENLTTGGTQGAMTGGIHI
jgi:hypothetical protein